MLKIYTLFILFTFTCCKNSYKNKDKINTIYSEGTSNKIDTVSSEYISRYLKIDVCNSDKGLYDQLSRNFISVILHNISSDSISFITHSNSQEWVVLDTTSEYQIYLPYYSNVNYIGKTKLAPNEKYTLDLILAPDSVKNVNIGFYVTAIDKLHNGFISYDTNIKEQEYLKKHIEWQGLLRYSGMLCKCKE
ncbi:hypothetical protein Fleli_2702 [Bernardetia litoralis DSM 6794]|uniref:Uncharacterized protein n=1 Tax=Bernardetia litoralis (strain ATCC 23117 / DSM 6794 / NBRC 15988 / NCIMB 1366 / Fx l1 / Sio-4) TaxID=880071 RepID=I4AM73_BERLS|nr:hypothetical protein [Bernardetia litoralis]AFM05058.1 hypothetical protein Fleli_2702 [Bernardetia litoralis DSM 6794]